MVDNMVDSKKGTLERIDLGADNSKKEIVEKAEKSPQTIVHKVKIERTKFLNQILKLLQLEERDEKDECTTRQKIICIIGTLITNLFFVLLFSLAIIIILLNRDTYKH